jgi:RHS repeat-associated protein
MARIISILFVVFFYLNSSAQITWVDAVGHPYAVAEGSGTDNSNIFRIFPNKSTSVYGNKIQYASGDCYAWIVPGVFTREHCTERIRASIQNNDITPTLKVYKSNADDGRNIIYLTWPNDAKGAFDVVVQNDKRTCKDFGCTSGTYSEANQVTYKYCIMPDEYTSIGESNFFTPNSEIPIILSSATQTATFKINWDNNVKKYCDPIAKIQYRVRSISGVTNSNNNYSPWANVADGGASFTAYKEGIYLFDLELLTTSGISYNFYQKKVIVYPSCGGDKQALTSVIPSLANNNSVIALPNNQYQIDPSTDYLFRILDKTTTKPTNSTTVTTTAFGITDFNRHYTISPNALNDQFITKKIATTAQDSKTTGSVIETNTYHQLPIRVNQKVGKYTINFTKNKFNFPDGYVQDNICLTIPPVSFTVGGSDKEIKENCPILLPAYLTNSGYASDDYILKHFTWKIISSSYVVVEPGVVLEAGAELKIETVPFIDPKDQDASLNFANQTVFDDYGRPMATSRQYFDESGQPTQIQVKDLVSNTILAQQTMYDRFGRAALQTLPAPIVHSTYNFDACGNARIIAGDQLYFAYKPNFLQDATNEAQFRYENFDDTKIASPDKPKQNESGTLGWYYSDKNIAPTLPADATGLEEPLVASTDYPYTQAVYNEDGTPDIKSTVAPSNIFRTNFATANAKSFIEPCSTKANAVFINYIKMRKEAFPTLTTPTLFTNNAWQSRDIDGDGVESIQVFDKDNKPLFSIQANGTVDEAIAMMLYDDVGRLRYEVKPKGYVNYTKTTTPETFAKIDKVTYSYDAEGRLEETQSNDEGRTVFMYRTDGQIRFSQNTVQRAASPERYSYTHYDRLARPIESGEYTLPGSGGTAWTSITQTLLDNIDPANELAVANCTERTIIYYDGVGDNSPSTFTRTFVRGKISSTEKVGISKIWFSYDERDRTIATTRYVNGLTKYFTTTYKYHSTGGILEVAYQPDVAGEQFYHTYTYFPDGRMQNAYVHLTKPAYTGEIPNSPTEKVASYEYYKHGPLKTVSLADGTQKQTYLYTPEGALKAINHPSTADNATLFGEELNYFAGDYTKTTSTATTLANPHYNGLVAGTAWRSITAFGSSPAYSPTLSTGGYRYQYDKKGQLTTAEYGTLNASKQFVDDATGKYDEKSITYDPNGNIVTLLRNNASGTALHNFTGSNNYGYDLNTNKLTSIPGYATFAYNAIGQCTTATYTSGVSHTFSYTVAGLVSKIVITGTGANMVPGTVDFIYDEGGRRLMKKFTQATGTPTTTWYIYDASGNVQSVYDNVYTTSVSLTEYPVYAHQRVATYYPRGPKFVYDLTDHLGNTRARFVKTTTPTAPTVEISFDYYPFGLDFNSSTSSWSERYKYQGTFAEKDKETQLNSFLLRQYSAVIGRWLMPDPYNEFYSPYNGMGNNPVSSVDPDGGRTSDDPTPKQKAPGKCQGCDGTPKSVPSSTSTNIPKKMDVWKYSPLTLEMINRVTPKPRATGQVDFDATTQLSLGFLTPNPANFVAKEKTFYRAMGNGEFAALESSGGLSHMAGKELFVSSSANYSRAYLKKSGYDVLVQFKMKPGAMNYFNQVGVVHRTTAGARGWAGRGSLLWKSEQGVMNLGIQSNTQMFNPWISSFKVIR